MNTRHPQRRAFWMVFAALQLLLPGAASILDARLEAESIRERPTAHIEEHGGPNCARIHPADCAFCRVLSATATPARPAAVAVALQRRATSTTDRVERVVLRARGGANPRAPPAAV